MTLQEKMETYNALCHAVQSGVKFDQESGSDDGSPKHLRVGVNTCKVENSVVVRLLVQKGVLTWDEYWDMAIQCMTEEVERYETVLARRFGKPIHLL